MHWKHQTCCSKWVGTRAKSSHFFFPTSNRSLASSLPSAPVCFYLKGAAEEVLLPRCDRGPRAGPRDFSDLADADKDLTPHPFSFLSPHPPKQNSLQGGTVVNGDASFRADVLVRGGKIAAVGLDIDPPSSFSSSPPSSSWLPKFFGSGADGKTRNLQNLKTIDCSGLLVLPGAIDPHTHLDAQMMGTTTADDFYTGTSAALAGGTTTLIDFALPRSGDGDLLAGLERYDKVAKVSACDYGFHMAVTNWSSRIEAQVGELTRNR